MRYIGFNCTDFMGMGSTGHTREQDFAAMRRLGFNFLRVPLNYRLWRRSNGTLDEQFLVRLDAALEAAWDEGLHLSLALHRAPGYSVSKEGAEPGNLWIEPERRARFVEELLFLADRYGHVPGTELSLNLVNEPPPVHAGFTADTYAGLILHCFSALRDAGFAGDIIADGLNYGRDLVPGLIRTGVRQGCRGYEPFFIANQGSPWRDEARSWPVRTSVGEEFGKFWLADHYRSWIDLARADKSLLCGEAGCPSVVPQDQALAWFKDFVTLLGPSLWGLALWQFRGPQGLVDSTRPDAQLVNCPAGKLDARLLELMLASVE